MTSSFYLRDLVWMTHRLDHCHGLAELMKRFQGLRAELSGKLQAAEATIRERRSYVGKDNLQRLYFKVDHKASVCCRTHTVTDDADSLLCVCVFEWFRSRRSKVSCSALAPPLRRCAGSAGSSTLTCVT